MTFRKLWQYCHTHTFCPGDKIRHKRQLHCLTFQIFFIRMHDTFHLITFIQSLYVLNITLFTN